LLFVVCGFLCAGDRHGADLVSAPQLARRLGTFDAVVIGLGAMLGAGVFATFGPAAAVAGPGLLLGLAIAGVVAYANATSSARLAALYPESGGTYVYGRKRLGDFWGYLAGWSFVVGKTASCAAMALTVGAYVAPAYARWIGAGTVVALTALNYRGVQKSAWATRAIVAVTLVVLAFVVYACVVGWPTGEAYATFSQVGFSDERPDLAPSSIGDAGAYAVLQSAGLLFFAFAGYARIATLGEEVRDPRRTIPRAIPIALGIVLAVYFAVALAVLDTAGVLGLAESSAPLHAAVAVTRFSDLAWIVTVGAGVAALGSLLALILGVSRTTFAMARDRHLPAQLSAVHERFRVPHRAELAVAVAVIALVLTVDLRGAIGFSSFGVLLYYAIANASALTLSREERRPPRVLSGLGVLGCLLLAFTLPWQSVAWGAGVLLVGAGVWLIRHLNAARPA
jgi:APA family basic amino acid/polyamine antiporter